MSFDKERGGAFADAVLHRGDEEWGDLAAALGPDGGPEVQLLKTRLVEQSETLNEAASDPETIRRVVEETRFIRQDIARMSKKHSGVVIQRRLGKMSAVYNRVVRAQGTVAENAQFDTMAQMVQDIVDGGNAAAFDEALLLLNQMRALFFNIAWRDQDYVLTWFRRLTSEPYLFPNAEEFKAMVAEGEALQIKDDREGMRDLVSRMLDARIALGASDIAGELATIVKN